MRRRLLLLLLVCAACAERGRGQPPSDANQGSHQRPEVSASGPSSLPDVQVIKQKVQLLSAGALPHKQLRYTAAVGDRGSILLSGTHHNRMLSDGVQLFESRGPSEILINTEVLEIGTDKSMRIALRIAKLQFPEFVPGMAPIADSDLLDEILLSNTGIVLRQDRSYLENREELTGLIDARDLTVPLPAEAVGIGARWQTKWTNFASGLARELVGSFELVSIDGSQVVLNSALEVKNESAITEAFGGSGALLEIKPNSFSSVSEVAVVLDAPLSSTGRWAIEFGAEMLVHGPFGTQAIEMGGSSVFSKVVVKKKGAANGR